ncbi:hypothetical protein RP75_23660 (plasmid) [Agrobacterium arsenijevicii]|uniref:Uncharacterized protein n=1 Tax=Agrobacterium arsenijevicii TaxID=1585697 RepID=A0ABR5D1W4_9HYPH|nr:hypothetical protein RP75_23660 [Agrobacterium arsenijevicii]
MQLVNFTQRAIRVDIHQFIANTAEEGIDFFPSRMCFQPCFIKPATESVKHDVAAEKRERRRKLDRQFNSL